jgi:hypothetical protein
MTNFKISVFFTVAFIIAIVPKIHAQDDKTGGKVGKFFKKIGDKAKEAVEYIQTTTSSSSNGGYSVLKTNCREQYYSSEQYWVFPPFEAKEQTKAKEEYKMIPPTSQEIQKMLVDALASKNLEKVKKYLAAGASPNALLSSSKKVGDVYCHYPLEIVAANGFTEGINLLVQKGAKLEYSAVLHIATLTKNESLFNFLFDKGANIYHLENGSKKIFWRKCFESSTAGLEYIEPYWWDKSNVSSRSYSNVLRYAMTLEQGYDDFIVRVILPKMEVTKLSYTVYDMGRMPLVVESARVGFWKTCKALVEKGLPVSENYIYFDESCSSSTKNIFSVSPVVFAINHGNNEMAKYLLSKGADAKFYSPYRRGRETDDQGSDIIEEVNLMSVAVNQPNNLGFIKHLVSLGCPINLPNNGILKFSRPEYKDYLIDNGGR